MPRGDILGTRTASREWTGGHPSALSGMTCLRRWLARAASKPAAALPKYAARRCVVSRRALAP